MFAAGFALSGNSFVLLSVFNGLGGARASAFLAGVFGTTRDQKGVLVGELDVDVLLGQSREFTGELVCLIGFLDIEARVELWKVGLVGDEVILHSCVDSPIQLLKVAGDRRELLAEVAKGRKVLSESWEEERHVASAG